jgi:glycosyltransferase involved in cell wall biosynthesis
MYTAVIATRLRDPYLIHALSSIYGQSYPPERVEVIVDAGHDLAKDWHDEIVDRFPEVSIRTQTGRGMISALNFGIERLATPYVSFLDSDDVWRPLKQEFQVAILEEDPSLHAVLCRAVNSTVKEDGEFESGRPTRSSLFTSTTFRSSTFSTFGPLDTSASHFVWLYRWWASARQAGIRTSEIEYIGLERRIHGANSWLVNNQDAHSELLGEIRRIVARNRGTAHA